MDCRSLIQWLVRSGSGGIHPLLLRLRCWRGLWLGRVLLRRERWRLRSKLARLLLLLLQSRLRRRLRLLRGRRL